MRLHPIEKTSNLLINIAYRWSIYKFGKVIAPLKIVYARHPRMMSITNKIIRTQEKYFSLAPNLRLLIQTQVSMLNGCDFCNDIVLAEVISKKLGAERFFALGESVKEHSKAFSDEERAIVNFVDEYAKNRKISDNSFEKLQRLFSEKEIVEIVAINAFEQYFNALSIPLEIESDGLSKLAEDRS